MLEVKSLIETSANWLHTLPLSLKYFWIVFGSAIEYVLPFIPSETIIIMSGFLGAEESLQLLKLYVALMFGSLIGCWLGYHLGYFLKRWQNRHPLMHTLYKKVEASQFGVFYARYGYLIILVNRFLPGIRAFVFMAAGMMRLPQTMVLLCGFISATVFNALVLALGVAFAKNANGLLALFEKYTKISLAIMGLALAVLVARWLFKKRK